MLSISSISSQDTTAIEHCSNENSGYAPQQSWQAALLPEHPSAPQLINLHGTSRVSDGLHNQDSSYPVDAAPKPTCFACNEQFSSQSSLSRHQKEQCEREMIAVCSLCPSRQAIYYTKERLVRHHKTTHGDKCSNECGKEVSSACKERLYGSFVKLPPKRTWGCPYCLSCFASFEDWNNHCLDHRSNPDDTSTWSFSTMVWSLLQNPDYMAARTRYDWLLSACDWSKMTEKTCPGFREVLERCKLPHDLRFREPFRSLSDCEAVVHCVFQFMSTGRPFPNQQLFEVQSAPVPPQASIASVQTFPTASSVPDPRSACGIENRSLRGIAYPHDRPDSATIPEEAVNKAFGHGSHSHSSLKVDNSKDAQSRTVQSQDAGNPMAIPARRRGASLKRTTSNLSLRQSSSRFTVAQPEVVPQVPPLPNVLRSLGTSKPDFHHVEEVLSSSYAETHRPMSGVISETSFFHD